MIVDEIRNTIENLETTIDHLDNLARNLENSNDVLEIDMELFGYRHDNLTTADRLVYSYIKKIIKIKATDNSQYISISQRQISDSLKISKYEVLQAIDNLEYVELLDVEKIRYNANKYRLKKKDEM